MVNVNGAFSQAQSPSYDFGYTGAADPSGSVDVTCPKSGSVTLKYVLHATLGGSRLHYDSPYIQWHKEPPNSSDWTTHVSPLDPYSLLITDPCDNADPYSFYLLINDGTGTQKKSQDPTVVNKARPTDVGDG